VSDHRTTRQRRNAALDTLERGTNMMTTAALSTFAILVAYALLVPIVIGDHLRKGPIRYWLDGEPVKCTCVAHQVRERHAARDAHS
jgi:hypothetical protein